jgi:hypothetical protein
MAAGARSSYESAASCPEAARPARRVHADGFINRRLRFIYFFNLLCSVTRSMFNTSAAGLLKLQSRARRM